MEVYALCQRVNGVPEGLYHYSVWNHALEPVRPGMSFEDFRDAMVAPSFVDDANVLLFLAAIFLRTQRKYGPRGYRYILLEAGHAAQNLCLMAVQAGLASLCIGGYLDSKLNRLLGLDEVKAGVVYTLATGLPSAESTASRFSE